MKPARRSWLAVAILAACTEPFEGEVHNTRYFEYHEQTDDPVCPGLFDLLDEHAETIAKEIGIELDPDNPIRYYRFRDQEALRDAGACREAAMSCADGDDGDSVASADPFNRHELAHAHTIRNWGHSIRLLTEGEAVALSCQPIFLDGDEMVTDLDADWRDFIDVQAGDKNAVIGYIAAGRFVTLLANRYGWEAVAMLHVQMADGGSAADLEEAFSVIFPESIDAVWAEAMRADATPCVEVAACPSRGPVELGTDARFECDGIPHQVLTVEPQSTVVVATTNSLFALRRCTNLERVRLRGEGDTVHWLSLPAGQYRFSDVDTQPSASVLSRTAGEAAHVEQVDPSPLVAPTCSAARRVPLDPQASTAIIVADRQDEGWIQIDGGGRTYAVDKTPSDSLDWVAFLCGSCDLDTCVSDFGDEAVIPDGAAVWMLGVEPDVVRSLRFTPVGQ